MEKLKEAIKGADKMSAQIEALVFEGRIKDTSTFLSIEIDGAVVQVTYHLTPGEPMVRYSGDGSGHPGSSDELSNIKIYFNGLEVTELYSERMDEVEDLIFERLEE